MILLRSFLGSLRCCIGQHHPVRFFSSDGSRVVCERCSKEFPDFDAIPATPKKHYTPLTQLYFCRVCHEQIKCIERYGQQECSNECRQKRVEKEREELLQSPMNYAD